MVASRRIPISTSCHLFVFAIPGNAVDDSRELATSPSRLSAAERIAKAWLQRGMALNMQALFR